MTWGTKVSFKSDEITKISIHVQKGTQNYVSGIELYQNDGTTKQIGYCETNSKLKIYETTLKSSERIIAIQSKTHKSIPLLHFDL